MVNVLLCKVQLSVGNINHACLARYFDIFHIYLKFKGCSYSVEWHCSCSMTLSCAEPITLSVIQHASITAGIIRGGVGKDDC